MKYRLKNDVIITLKREGVVINKNNFSDDLAELILSDERYRADYGHNIEVLDKKALAALEERAKNQNKPTREPKDIVIEVEVEEKKPEPKKVPKKTRTRKRGR